MKPNFIKSPYFVPEPDNWHLKPGAPPEVQKEFDEYMAADKAAAEKNIIID